jgi:AcrR family transcriptional regulator
MGSYTKGIQSREYLINQAREILNENGLELTLGKLANRLGITLGKLTYHFPTRDHLFIAISETYEARLSQLLAANSIDSPCFEMLISLSARIMDLQYEYRCAIRYVAASVNRQTELSKHISGSYKNSRTRTRQMVQALIAAGELTEKILDEPFYGSFHFCWTNLFTTWVINLEIYDNDKTYQEMKPIYLRGIFSVYKPYLTPNGLKALSRADLV